MTKSTLNDYPSTIYTSHHGMVQETGHIEASLPPTFNLHQFVSRAKQSIEDTIGIALAAVVT